MSCLPKDTESSLGPWGVRGMMNLNQFKPIMSTSSSLSDDWFRHVRVNVRRSQLRGLSMGKFPLALKNPHTKKECFFLCFRTLPSLCGT